MNDSSDSTARGHQNEGFESDNSQDDDLDNLLTREPNRLEMEVGDINESSV